VPAPLLLTGATGPLDRLALGCGLLWMAGAALTPWVGLWAGIGGTGLCLGVACAWKAHPLLAPLFRITPRGLLAGLAAAAVMVAATYGLFPVVASSWPLFGAGVPPLYAAFREGRPPGLLYLLPLIILAEEVVWRGIVYDALRRRMRPGGAVAVCGAAYALAHAPAGSLVLALVALGCGLFWAALRETTGSLVPATLSHLVWDLLVMVCRPLSGGL
jgi:membrane protease YdiL (CAAX protease family)